MEQINRELVYKMAEKWVESNFDFFCECMNLIKEQDPQKWEELHQRAIDLSVPYSPPKD